MAVRIDSEKKEVNPNTLVTFANSASLLHIKVLVWYDYFGK